MERAPETARQARASARGRGKVARRGFYADQGESHGQVRPAGVISVTGPPGAGGCRGRLSGRLSCYPQGNGEAGGMIDYVIAGVLLIIIASTLIMLKRAER